MHFLIRETLSFNLMYVTACYPVGTTISKTSSLFTALLQHYECLLISSLPGKASKTLLESLGLPSNLTCDLESKPGKLEIKICKPGILFISLPIGSLFKLVIMT